MKLVFILLLSLSSYAFAGLKMGNVEIKGFEKFPEQQQRIEDSLVLIEDIINSDEFKEQVISFQGKSGKGFSSTKLTPAQVYESLMQGRELSSLNDSNGEMNFSLKRWKFSWIYRKKVVAESEPRKNTEIRLSNWFYSWYGTSEMAGNITHEWIHLLGFSHADADDLDSVPYAVGDIMRELVEKRLKADIESVLE